MIQLILNSSLPNGPFDEEAFFNAVKDYDIDQCLALLKNIPINEVSLSYSGKQVPFLHYLFIKQRDEVLEPLCSKIDPLLTDSNGVGVAFCC